MGLVITRVEYGDFRSYRRFTLDGVGDMTLIVGPNATGKTNALEGIQLTTAMASFRAPRAEHLIRDGATSCFVKTAFSDDSRRVDIELRVTPEEKTYLFNGKPRRAHTLRGIAPSVMFCPDDLDLVKGAQSIKRSQLDALGAQLSANYHAVRKDYDKILRQKNRSLKEGVSGAYLASINEVMATVGAQLYRFRAQLVDSLAPYVQELYRSLARGKERVGLVYVPSWERTRVDLEREVTLEPLDRQTAADVLLAAMGASAADEAERRSARVGPHLDRLEFFLDGRNASSFASQGQQRSIVLAYKMAELLLLRDRLDQAPILLLDDVMSELDDDRRRALIELVSGEVQTFMTATNAERFDLSAAPGAAVVRLEADRG